MDNETKNNKYDKYYQMLELKPNASFTEIKSAYLHLKKLYSSESPVLSTMIDEIPESRRKELLAEIEEAYLRLKECCSSEDADKQKKTSERAAQKNVPEFDVYTGNALKLTRETLGVELQEIALSTGIPLRNLQCIENEQYEFLPPQGYVRIYVNKYAEYLSLDAKRVADDYIKGMEKKKQKVYKDKF